MKNNYNRNNRIYAAPIPYLLASSPSCPWMVTVLLCDVFIERIALGDSFKPMATMLSVFMFHVTHLFGRVLRLLVIVRLSTHFCRYCASLLPLLLTLDWVFLTSCLPEDPAGGDGQAALMVLAHSLFSVVVKTTCFLHMSLLFTGALA